MPGIDATLLRLVPYGVYGAPTPTERGNTMPTAVNLPKRQRGDAVHYTDEQMADVYAIIRSGSPSTVDDVVESEKKDAQTRANRFRNQAREAGLDPIRGHVIPAEDGNGWLAVVSLAPNGEWPKPKGPRKPKDEQSANKGTAKKS